MPNDLYIYSISPKGRGMSAEEYMLRQSGDWKGYLAMSDSGAISSPSFFRALINYYATGIKSFEMVTPLNRGLLIGTSVWGDEYIRRFLGYCLPSLMEANNLAALKAKGATLFIHTDAAGQQAICNHPITNYMIGCGINVQVMLLNDELLRMVNESPPNKYWHLGMTQSLHLQYAKALKTDYHLMMPDMVYSAGYFERLLSLKKKVITHGCLSVSEEIPLSDYRNEFAISISASKLMTLSLMHAHPRACNHYIRQNKKWTSSHVVIMEGKDALHLMSPHQTIAYLSKEVIARIPDRIFFTLDSELDKIVGDAFIYSPHASDGLVASEISGNVGAFPPRQEVIDIKDYGARFTSRIPEKKLIPLFLRGMTFPIEREMLGDRWYMKDDEISAMKKEVSDCLGT